MDVGADTDGDGTQDFLDTDSDGDSLPDQLEGQTKFVGCNSPQNTDGADQPDFRDTDSDNNGLPDAAEVYPSGAPYDAQKPAPNPADTDGDGVPDYADNDNDNDSLPDDIELGGGFPLDTDNDGLPDLDDTDSDADTIADAFEGVGDTDGDAIPAFRDTDSEGDGLSDKCEAGAAHALPDPPPDTDNDGKYDTLDLDSDGDGIPDGVEDADHDCALDPDETSPTLADTDGDAVNDFIEITLGSDPRDALSTPAKLGKTYFVLPYLEAVAPTENVVPLQTTLTQGDLAFVVDTTATMGGAIQALKSSMSTIIQDLHAKIPDLGVGVAGVDDFPTGNYGTPGLDLPFYISGPGTISTDLGDNLTAMLLLNLHDGGDAPESQIAAMHRALTDTFLIWDSGQIAPTGAPGGRYGSLQFRSSAYPIVVLVTDAPFHNGRRANAPASLHDTYSFNDTPPFPTPTIDQLVPVIQSTGARFVGISVSNGARAGSDPYEDMAYLSDQTGSNVPPSAFGGAQCATGLSGSFLPPDGPITADAPGGSCRLIYDTTSAGLGISSSVESGVTAVLTSVKLDLRALAAPDAGAVDAVDTFIESVSVDAGGGDDPVEPGVPCVALSAVSQLTDIWSGPKGIIKMQDAVNETALGVTPGQKVCFKVVPKPNTTVPQVAGAQVFKATLTVKAKNGISPVELVLGAPREIAFIVPPAPQ